MKNKRWSVYVSVVIMLCGAMAMSSCARKKEMIVNHQWGQVRATAMVQQFISVTNVRVRTLDSGNLQVSLKVVNPTHNDLALRFKFQFLDDGGFQIEETNWQPYMIERGMTKDIIENSISYQAEDFLVYIDFQE
jgi:hypothetical protein